jgi:hypothetical protein
LLSALMNDHRSVFARRDVEAGLNSGKSFGRPK